MRTARIRIRELALLSITATMAFGLACSDGGDAASEPTATPQVKHETTQTSPSASLDALDTQPTDPVVIVKPRIGGVTFNDADLTHTISGFALDSSDGIPLRGVEIKERKTGAQSVSDEFGFYRVEGLEPGRHTLDISGYRIEPITMEIDSETWTRQDFSVNVVGDIGTRRVFDVVGTVTDRDSGIPISNAVVSAVGDELTINATVNDSGAYVISAAPVGRYSVSVTSKGYPVHSDVVDIEGDIALEVFLRAAPSTISGHISGDGPNGSRVPIHSSVRVIDIDSDASAVRAVATSRVDSDGAYAINGLVPGRYKVEVVAPAYESSEVVVELSSGSERELNFSLSMNGSSLYVNLTSSTYNDMPVTGTTVRLQGVGGGTSDGVSLETISDHTGLASIVNVPAGTYDVWTPQPKLESETDIADLYPLHRTVTISESDTLELHVDLQAIPGDVHGFIHGGDKAGQTRIGTLLRTASQSPGDDSHKAFAYLPIELTQAMVEVTSAQFGGQTFYPETSSTISDGFGNYVLSLPPGNYDIAVSSTGYVTHKTSFTVTSASISNEIQLQRAATALVGRVTGTSIQDLTHLTDAEFAISGANVLLRKGEESWASETDSRGVFSLENLPLLVLDGATVETEYQLEISHPDYLPLTEDLFLSNAEGAATINRKMPQLAAAAFLNISISVTDKDGWTTAGVGTLESFQNLRTMDVYDARFSPNSETVEIPNTLSIRARPGQYRARVCPDVIGLPRCFDHFWNSVGGDVDTLNLSFNCGDSERIVKCSLDGGIAATSAGHVQSTGFIYSATTGLPVPDAKVSVKFPVLTQYCADTCTGFVREFEAVGPSGPNGRYQMEFEIPESNGGADLTQWSWQGVDRYFTITAPGYETFTNTGSAENVRLFDGPQSFHLVPANNLNLQIVGSTTEATPVTGLAPGLGIPVAQAKVTLVPTGSDLHTDANGLVSFNIPAGSTTVRVDAPGHYPYLTSLQIPVSPDGEPVQVSNTLQLEQIPPPKIRPETFQIVNTSDGRLFKGYVIHGLSAPATNTTWMATVDRSAAKNLRDNFIDPVESVNLVTSVLESCPDSDGSVAGLGTLHLSGKLLSGSPNGVGTWGGEFDASDLPCGTLGWRIEARTSRSLTTHGADWPIWPSEQRYPLSLLTSLSQLGSAPSTDPVRSPFGADMKMSATPGSLLIDRNGEYLKYLIPNIVVDTSIGSPIQDGLIEEFSEGGPAVISEQTVTVNAVLDGQSGLLDIRVNSDESGPYSLTADNLFSLKSRVSPSTSNQETWVEMIETTESSTRSNSVEVSNLPPPLRSVLTDFGLTNIDGTVTTNMTLDGSWELSPSPETLDESPIYGERKVVSGAHFETVSTNQFEYHAHVMSHLSVDGHVATNSTTRFAEHTGSGDLLEVESITSGPITTTRKLWSLWQDTRSSTEYRFFDRTFGNYDLGDATSIEGDTTWKPRFPAPFVSPPGSQTSGIVAMGGSPRPGLSAARSQDGRLFLASTHLDTEQNHPATSRLSFMEAGPSSVDWSEPSPLEFVSGGVVTDTSMIVTPGGDLLLVWSEIPNPSEDASAFVYQATKTELRYSRLETDTGTWSDPEYITADNRADFAPVLSSDGEGRIVVAWARDMDGNVLTADDIVIFTSDWISNGWTPAQPVISAPGAISELSLSLANGSAVIGVVTNSPDLGKAIRLSFNSLGRWSPANVIGIDRSDLSDVSVIMQSTGVGLVVWNEVSNANVSRLVSVEATSAGIRGETVVADGVTGLVDLSLTATDQSIYLTWVSHDGSHINYGKREPGQWASPISTKIEHGTSNRLITLAEGDYRRLLTFHQATVDEQPAVMFIPIQID